MRKPQGKIEKRPKKKKQGAGRRSFPDLSKLAEWAEFASPERLRALPGPFEWSGLIHDHGIAFAFKTLMKTSGYRLELRRAGDLKLGLWRKSFSTPVSKLRRFVLIPGFGDSPASWLSSLMLMAPALRRGFDEVVIFDFPGYPGALAAERAFPSMDLCLRACFDALDSLGPHTLLGHSLGGWIAGAYSAECGLGVRPLRLNELAGRRSGGSLKGPERLVLVSPSGVFGNEAERSVLAETFMRVVREGFEPLRGSLFVREPSWFGLLVSEFDRFARREDVGQFLKSFEERHTLDAKAHSVRAETWLVWGEHDRLVPSSWAEHWLTALEKEAPDGGAHDSSPALEAVPETLPRTIARTAMIQDCGHIPQIERPAVTAAVLGQIVLGLSPHPFGHRWWKPLAGT